MTYFAARSLRGGRNVPGEDGVAMLALRPRLPSRYETIKPQEAGAASDIAGEELFPEAESVPRRAAPTLEQAAIAAPEEAATPAAPAAAVSRDTVTPRRAEPPRMPARPPARADRGRGPDPAAPTPPRPEASAETAAAVAPLSRPWPAPPTNPPPVAEEPRSEAAPRRERPPPSLHESGDATGQRQDREPMDSIAPKPPQPVPPAGAAVAAPLRESIALRVAPALPRLGDGAHPPLRPRDTGMEKAPASPRIEVTIGRIEIRATTIPAPPRKASRPPSMSLDDYLAKRDSA